ncbi:MAG: MBL fold metallo-hydrolase [Sediminibacterium sp.]
MQHPALNINFLGTGTSSGVPMIGCHCEVCRSQDPRDNRLRSSILVSSATTSFVIDTTPDFRYQMLRSKTERLDAIVFTHPHKDHIAGLDDIRAFNHFSRNPIDIYAGANTEEAIRRDFYYAFTETRYPGVPDLNIVGIDRDPFMVGDIKVQPIQVMHHKMAVLGFRMGDFTYITDANYIEPKEQEKIKGSKVLVINALRKQKHLSHFTLSEAIEQANALEIPRVYLTHISHQLGTHTAVSHELPANISLAYDGLQISL